MIIVLHAMYRLLLIYCNETRMFMTHFQEIIKYQISWKSDRRTDRHDEVSHFLQFSERT
jgi:hypothetical protein